MSGKEWLSVAVAASRAGYSTNYFRTTFCFPSDGSPRPFQFREFPTIGGRRRIQVNAASLAAWLKSLES